MTVDDYAVDVLMRDPVGYGRRAPSFLVDLGFTFQAARVRREHVQVSY